jgi:hypothetical protein
MTENNSGSRFVTEKVAEEGGGGSPNNVARGASPQQQAPPQDSSHPVPDGEVSPRGRCYP